MSAFNRTKRHTQARTRIGGSTQWRGHWLAAAILLAYALFAPAVTLAAPILYSSAKPNAAPRAQGLTAVRWVDGVMGSLTMLNQEGNTVPSNCTLVVFPDDPDTADENEEAYKYNSCPTITYALSVANPGDIIHVAGGMPG